MRHRTIEQLTRVATLYRVAIEDGKSPVDHVAETLGISYGAAKHRIWRARHAGLDMRPARRFDTADSRLVR